jgi:malate dehydrogenase
MTRIGLVGFGGIGVELAKVLVSDPAITADIVAYDIPQAIEQVPGLQRGAYAEIVDAIGILGGGDSIKLTSNAKDLAGSEVIIFTAGRPRTADMDRIDLVGVNVKIVGPLCETIKEVAPNAFMIMVTNPLDIMVELAYRTLGFADNMIVGQAGVLDTGRLRYQASEKTGVPCSQISALVLGGHGPTMVPCFSQCNVAHKPVSTLVDDATLKVMHEEVADRGRTVIKQQGRSAIYSTAVAAAKMAKAYLLDTKEVMACCTRLNGEYGASGLFAGVPTEISANGVKPVEVPLAGEDKAKLDASIEKVKEEVALLEKVLSES